MVIISNSQREQILRYIDLLCATLQDDSTRTYNIKRMAKILARKLADKPTVSADDCRAFNNRKQQ